jgi:hypothetical protein
LLPECKKNLNVKDANRLFENVAKLRHLRTKLTDQIAQENKET